ncbi:Bystin-domain-containing protein [Xylaria sp. CBS 124048]|nr:Bystin-domain-containing protein [Xylaria sp. CBS 124048]
MPKATTPSSGHRRALDEEYLVGSGLLKNRPSKSKGKSRQDDDEERENNFIDARSSRKILDIGRQLAEEDAPARQSEPTTSSAFGFSSRFEDAERAGSGSHDDEDEAWAEDDDDDEIIEHVDINPDDLQTFQQFIPSEFDDPLLTEGPWPTGQEPSGREQQTSTNLADLLAKIAAHEAGGQERAGPVSDGGFDLSPKVVEAYGKIGLFLSRYKSGKLPKAFKILPTVPHWEDIIQLTKPHEWTPNAVLAATKLFVSSTPAVARQFLNMVLLEHVRDNIGETKKLNVHLFDALRKALYKPAAFFKGILFPLVESGATLREAHILSAVLSRVSIPVLHSGAALKGLCDIAAREASAGTEGGGATNVFIKTLLDKRYALPWQVVDSLVFHFLRFRNTDPASVTEDEAMNMGERAATQAKLPVIWHQTLLSFAVRYKNEISEDQRELLLDLLLTHGHHKIGPEIRRELLAGRGRGVVAEPQGPALDGDDTMLIDG